MTMYPQQPTYMHSTKLSITDTEDLLALCQKRKAFTVTLYNFKFCTMSCTMSCTMHQEKASFVLCHP